MLAREFKLKSSDEVKTVLKLGHKYRGKFLTLFVATGAHKHPRVAVVVGGKVAGSAVRRNRIRRIIFSQLRDYFDKWGDRAASDMVVMVMNIPEDENKLRADLEQCFARW